MKTLKSSLLLLIAICIAPFYANAQQTLSIPLENPGEPGSLSLEALQSSITVIGYEGDKVLISNGDDDESEETEVTEDGLRKISGGPGFEITKHGNTISIGNVSFFQSSDFKIKVPRNFSLNISTLSGDLHVKNVSGELELSSVNGDITLKNVNGSANVNTVNGDITADFNSVAANDPMAFTTLSGDIDVALPADAAFSAKIDSERGDVYTDFNLNIKNRSQRSSTNGMVNVSVNEEIHATVNGGGPEYLFKSLNGDIFIRKQ